MLRGNQHGGRKYDDLQNWLNMTSHENPLLFAFVHKHLFAKLKPISSRIAMRGSRGDKSAPPDSEKIAKNWENFGKRGKKSGKRGKKSGRGGKIGKKRQKSGRFFTLPLLTDRADYAISCHPCLTTLLIRWNIPFTNRAYFKHDMRRA